MHSGYSPPHGVFDVEKFTRLYHDMLKNGWQGPPLYGVGFGNHIQLITGSHRYEAARIIHKADMIASREPTLKVPICIVDSLEILEPMQEHELSICPEITEYGCDLCDYHEDRSDVIKYGAQCPNCDDGKLIFVLDGHKCNRPGCKLCLELNDK